MRLFSWWMWLRGHRGVDQAPSGIVPMSGRRDFKVVHSCGEVTINAGKFEGVVDGMVVISHPFGITRIPLHAVGYVDEIDIDAVSKIDSSDIVKASG